MSETLIFIDFSKDEYAEVIREIHPRRAEILFCASIDEMVRLIPMGAPSLTIVGLPFDNTADKIVMQFINDLRLREHNFVFLGVDVLKHKDKITLKLPHSIVLKYPISSHELYAVVTNLPSSEDASAAQPTLLKKTPFRSKNGSSTSKLTECFKALSTLRADKIKVDCSAMYRARRIEDIGTSEYIPTHSRVRQISDSLTKEAGVAGGAHLHRSAAVSSRILSLLKVNDSTLESARNVAFLFSWEFIDQPGLFTVDFMEQDKHALRSKIAGIIERTAERVGKELGLVDEQKILKTISQLLSGEYHLGDDSLDIVSSSVLISDLADRACWKGNTWDPRGINAVMNRFGVDQMPEIHPKVFALTLKSFCEAIEGMGANLLRARSRRHSVSVSSLDRTTPKLPTARLGERVRREKVVALSQLSPDMKVSQPVSTLDGRTLIAESTRFDEDLIWRLWQLAAICPLAPVRVFSD